MEQQCYDYWLANLKGVSAHTKILLTEQYGNARTVYETSKHTLQSIPYLHGPQISAIDQSRRSWDLTGKYRQFQQSGTKLITFQDPAYPFRLSTLNDAPYAFYLKGSLPDQNRKTVAIVGARACSPYGKKLTEQYVQALVRAGVNIISGMAIGIDGIAQRTALDNHGYSLAVLGCGVEVCYPERHRPLYTSLIKQGGIISEYPIFDPPLRGHFPQRNRLISVLSDAVIVIEAREKSGSLITADFALEQGLDVYALPGPADSPLSWGCHRLIEQGAHILINPEELISDLGTMTGKETSHIVEEELPDLSVPEQKIVKCLTDTPVKLSELELMTGLEPQVLANSLVSMQLKGIAREFSMQHYVRA